MSVRPLKLSERNQATRRFALRTQLELPPADVVPRAHLPTDPSVSADVREAGGLVERNARLVGERDAGEGPAVALLAKSFQQLVIQDAADAHASKFSINVDAGLH